jgi:hypothetical protein
VKSLRAGLRSPRKKRQLLQRRNQLRQERVYLGQRPTTSILDGFFTTFDPHANESSIFQDSMKSVFLSETNQQDLKSVVKDLYDDPRNKPYRDGAAWVAEGFDDFDLLEGEA